MNTKPDDEKTPTKVYKEDDKNEAYKEL